MAAAVKIRAAVTAYAGELKDDMQISTTLSNSGSMKLFESTFTCEVRGAGHVMPEPGSRFAVEGSRSRSLVPSSRALTVALRFAHGSVVVAAEKDNPARNAAGRLACLPGMEGESDTMMAVAQCERASRRALAHARN
jgi:hypothetical protein